MTGRRKLKARHSIRRTLGDQPPMPADGRRTLDRRDVSARWLAGTVLVGLTSSALMGYSLFAAVEGRTQLAVPGNAFRLAHADAGHQVSARGGRVAETPVVGRAVDKAVVKVPVVTREGGTEVVRPQAFALVRMALASDYKIQRGYPPFDPVSVMSEAASAAHAPSPVAAIYSSDVASQISFTMVPFPANAVSRRQGDEMTQDEIERHVRNGSSTRSGAASMLVAYQIDPSRFGAAKFVQTPSEGASARVLEENVSLTYAAPDDSSPRFADDVVASRTPQTVSELLAASGYDASGAASVEAALAVRLGSNRLASGDVLRIGILQARDTTRVVRIGLYRAGAHVVTLAVTDGQRLVQAEEPPLAGAVAAALDAGGEAASQARGQGKVYDAIYRAALSYGMNERMIARVMRLVSAKVDLQAGVRASDKLEAFFSAVDEDGRATDSSELLYLRARFGDSVVSFYRFEDPKDRKAEFYNEEGKGLRPLLLRTPLPAGRVTSGFGGRMHPVLGYEREHTGVDMAAPRGTPIMAVGDGVVEKAGWSSSYGNHTVVRHANGFVTSYSHQSAIARGIVEGAKVTQGQVIGFVGSTGRSTGPHLHYELAVNGTRVDAMKARLPQARDLDGRALERFRLEKERIDALLERTRT